MEGKFNDLNIQDKKDINILLLGETGVGKSTFINSIANYLHHQDLKRAKQEPLFHLIPCMFNITDEQNQLRTILVGKDSNEYQQPPVNLAEEAVTLDTPKELQWKSFFGKLTSLFNFRENNEIKDLKNTELGKVGSSATQDVKTYVFPIGDGQTRLRLIDSPGMGDPRGVDQDDINCENILTYISQLHELHAICFLFKPNDSRITVTFEYCVKQILSRLDKSAANNIIFIFTNTKGTHYKPGETIACLKQVVEDIRKESTNVDIKVDQNVFCFDNEAFRYLAAIKQGIIFGRIAEEEYRKSWKTSSEEGEKLIRYIVGDKNHKPLKPHPVKASTSINEARRVINQLGQPLTDISQLILDNLRILDRRESELKQQNLSLEDLRSKLYVPIINLKVIKLTQPATVCCDEKCSECILVDGTNIWNYKQRCHDPCYLTNVPQEIVGAPQLINCASMDRATQKCMKCGCAQTVHMHIYYMTEKFDDKRLDDSIRSRINTTQKALNEAERVISEINKRKKELEQEKEAIINCAAKFAAFLQKNAITPFNDAYRKYLNYMIFRESNLRENADQQLLQHLQNLLMKYDKIKETFDKASELSIDIGGTLDAKNISAELIKLYSLKHNGLKIKELYISQKFSRKKEYEKTEYVHSSPVLNIGKKSQQRQVMSDIEGNVRKNEYHNKQNKQLKQFKPYKSQNYFNKNTLKNGVETIVSGAHGSDEKIKIEITKIRNSNLKYGKNSGNRFKGNNDINHRSPGDNRPREPVAPSDYRPNDVRPPYDNRSPYDSRPPYDNRPYDNRPPNDSRPPYDNRPPYESRPPNDSRPPYDNCPPYESRPPYDNRPPYESRPPYDNRPPYESRPHYDNRPPYESRPPYDSRPHYDNRPPYESRPPYDNRPPYESRPPYDIRPPYDNRPPYESRPPYDNRPPYESRPPNDSRPPYDNHPPYDKQPAYKSRAHYDDPRPHTPYDHRPPYDNQKSYDEQRYARDREYFHGTNNENRNYGTSQTTYGGRPDERVSATDHNNKPYNVPPPPYHAVGTHENRKIDTQDSGHQKRNRRRSRPKYRSSGEKYSSHDSD